MYSPSKEETTSKRVLRSLLLFVWLFITANSAETQSPAAAKYPPLGKLIDVGGYRVHLYCVGSGSPTVVITGAGYSFDWGLVQPEVAKFTRVCAYDHSGIAWSDPGPTDSCSLRVGEIHRALSNAKINGPYVLVGHSLGALVSRLYASKYPDDVAGMVIVDHAGLRNANLPQSAAPPLPPGPLPDPNRGFEKLPAHDYELHVWANSLVGSAKIMATNSAINPRCASDVETATRNQGAPLKDKPLIVVSNPGNVPDYVELQNKLLLLSSNSSQVIAENSGHYIMVDRPDVVVTAIRDVVQAAQNHSKVKN